MLSSAAAARDPPPCPPSSKNAAPNVTHAPNSRDRATAAETPSAEIAAPRSDSPGHADLIRMFGEDLGLPERAEARRGLRLRLLRCLTTLSQTDLDPMQAASLARVLVAPPSRLLWVVAVELRSGHALAFVAARVLGVALLRAPACHADVLRHPDVVRSLFACLRCRDRVLLPAAAHCLFAFAQGPCRLEFAHVAATDGECGASPAVLTVALQRLLAVPSLLAVGLAIVGALLETREGSRLLCVGASLPSLIAVGQGTETEASCRALSTLVESAVRGGPLEASWVLSRLLVASGI